jgi:hypothetical protein
MYDRTAQNDYGQTTMIRVRFEVTIPMFEQPESHLKQRGHYDSGVFDGTIPSFAWKEWESPMKNLRTVSEICDFHGGEYEDDCLLGFCSV